MKKPNVISKMNDKTFIEYQKSSLPLALNVVKAALQKLVPSEVKTLKKVDWSLSSDGYIEASGVLLYPVIYESRCIGGVMEVCGWQVQIVRYYPATREQPEEFDPVNIGDPSANMNTAVKLFVETVFSQVSENYWENIAMAEMAREGW